MSDLKQKLAALSPEQREALEQKIKHKKAEQEAQGKTSPSHRRMNFSLIFFSGDGSTDQPDKYKLVLESAKFADRNGFAAVWTPERHFQPIGGLYPNPSLLSAAIASVTDNIQLRAGSVVLPLHHPIRVAEDWSVVDNLSNGRAAISVATGWHPADFVLNPELYESRKEVMFHSLDQIRRLWRGEAVSYRDIAGEAVDVRILPRPIQRELPIFLTASGNPATWEKAGELGFNILCSLANHPAEGLKERIQLYRQTREKHGHDPGAGIVSVMLHTYVGDNDKEVKDLVREPLRDYLNTFLGQYETPMNPYQDEKVMNILNNDRDTLINFAFEKYFQMSSLMGSKEKCRTMVERLRQYGVDEIACLLDYGLDVETIMEGLHHLAELRNEYAPLEAQIGL